MNEAIQLILSLAFIIGLIALLLWALYLIGKRNKNSKTEVAILITCGLLTFIALYLFAVHSIENGFQWKSFFNKMHFSLNILSVIIWVFLIFLAPSLFNTTWKSIAEKFNKNS